MRKEVEAETEKLKAEFQRKLENHRVHFPNQKQEAKDKRQTIFELVS